MTDTNMSRKTLFLPNRETYDRWSHTYDTDGNILQAIDTAALQRLLLANLLHDLAFYSTDDGAGVPTGGLQGRGSPLRLVDMGCGTGRAVLTLLESLSPRLGSIDSDNDDEDQACIQAAFGDLCKSIASDGRAALHVLGLDASSGMLSVARTRVPRTVALAKPCPRVTATVTTEFAQWDANSPNFHVDPAHAVMSTLVMEHLDLPTFFLQLSKCLLPGGIALITNMHPDMGNMAPSTVANQRDGDQTKGVGHSTGAGFIDPTSGSKIRAAVDHVHTIPDVLEAAGAAGFGLLRKEIRECKVEQWMLESDRSGDAPLLGDRGHKWLGVNVWFGMILRKNIASELGGPSTRDAHVVSLFDPDSTVIREVRSTGNHGPTLPLPSNRV